MNHSVTNANGKFHTRDGKSFSTMEEAQAHSFQKRQELEARWNYEIDDSTWRRQGVTAANDSRSFTEQANDEKYTPKKRENVSPLDRQIQQLQEAGAKKREGDEYKNLNREERLALDLRKQRDRQEAEQKADAVKAAHLEANAASIEAVEELIYQEQFNPESDQRFREQLRKLQLAYQEPSADPAELDQLKTKVNQELIDRQANEQGLLQQEQEQLQARLQRVNQQLLLDEPEPESEEHEPDPNSYPDPMATYTPEPDAEPALPKASIDTTRNLKEQISSLSEESFAKDFPLANRKEIIAAKDQLKEGNEVPAMEVLAKYVG